MCEAVFYPDPGLDPRANSAGLIPHLRLDRLHVGVRQPEMMADLVDQDVPDDMAQGFVMLGPVVEDRTAIEPDQVWQPGDVVAALERQADALE